MAYKKILLRRDTASNWTSANPTLSGGEMGVETDTLKFKLGNGATAWNSLNYYAPPTLNDVGDVTITSASNGDFLRWNGSAWINDAVDLATDTIGSFVQSLVAGTGITLANNSGENSTPTVAVDTTVIQARVADVSDTEIGYLNGVTSAIQTQIDAKAPLASPTFTGTATANDLTVSGNLIVSGTTTSINTSTLNVADNIVILNNDVTGSPTENAGIEVERGTSANVLLRWNETEDRWEITTDGTTYGTIATTTDISNSETTTNNALALKANLDSPTFTGTVILPDNTVALGAKTTGNYVASLVAGTGITLANNSGETATPTVTVDTTVIQARVADVSDTEIGYLNGVTSAIQTQLNDKAPIASPTFTGTVTIPTGASITAPTGLVKGDVGLGNVDNTSDANKPVSSATQTALDLKANLASPTFTGTVTIPTGASITAPIGLVKGDVGLGNVDNTSDTNKPVSTATQTALDLKAPLASPTFTGTVTLPDNTVALGTKTTGDYVATITAGTGVTSSAATTGEGTTHTLSIGQSVATDANPSFAGATLDAVQIGITAAGEIDTTSGNLTIDSAGGTVTVDDNLTVTGNLTVSGTTTSVNTETLTVDDNIVVLNNNVTGSPTENAGIEVERGTSANVLVRWNETSDKWETTNDGTTYGNIVTTADSGTVTSAMLADGTIVNADISASAAIALSKLATSTAGNIIVYNSSGVPTSVTETGDVTISDTGVTAISSGVIVNADISSTAAIELGKLADVSTSAQTASYTLVLDDKNKIVEMSVSSANNLTVPPNSSVAFPVGSQINILQTGTGQTTVVAGSGVTVNATPGLKIRAQWSYATLIKRATDTWVLVGDISA